MSFSASIFPRSDAMRPTRMPAHLPLRTFPQQATPISNIAQVQPTRRSGSSSAGVCSDQLPPLTWGSATYDRLHLSRPCFYDSCAFLEDRFRFFRLSRTQPTILTIIFASAEVANGNYALFNVSANPLHFHGFHPFHEKPNEKLWAWEVNSFNPLESSPSRGAPQRTGVPPPGTDFLW